MCDEKIKLRSADITEKRDELIEALEQKLQQTTHVDDLFVIRWNLI